MSDPYVYNPQPSYSAYRPSQYHDSHYLSAQSSPFIPNATLYPTSPFGNTASLPGSPNLGSASLPPSPKFASRYLYADGIYEPEGPIGSTWNIPQRQRRPSWHGGLGNLGTPMSSNQYLEPGGYFQNRRHSHGAANVTAPYNMNVHGWHAYTNSYSPYANIHPPLLPQTQIHPWLNGEAPRGDFLFDISWSHFSPQRLIGPGQRIPLTMEDLSEPAFHPPVSRLRIVCDLIPQWPIDLQYNPYYLGQDSYAAMSSPPPITFGDILIAIHRNLHQRISHLDWGKLSISMETAVSRTYGRRCKQMGSLQMVERANGVKRVDFLLGRSWFRGLVPMGGDVVKLIVG